MKKSLDPKAIIVILGIAALVIVWLGWKMAFAPKPGQEAPPPYSTRPKPLVVQSNDPQAKVPARDERYFQHKKSADPNR